MMKMKMRRVTAYEKAEYVGYIIKQKEVKGVIDLLLARCCKFIVEPWPEDDTAVYVNKGEEHVLKDCINAYFPF